MVKRLVIYSPCFENPYLPWSGRPRDDTLKFVDIFKKFINYYSKYSIFLSYPCPETASMGIPRPPSTKDVYSKIPIVIEIAKNIVEYIENVVNRINPDLIVFVGKLGSPLCGAKYTTYSDGNYTPDIVLTKKFRKALELKENFTLKKEPGILFDFVKEKFPNAVYCDLSFKDAKSLVEQLRWIVRHLQLDDYEFFDTITL